MKNFVIFLMGLACFISSTPAFAKKEKVTTTTTTTREVAEGGGHTMRFGMGVSTWGGVPGALGAVGGPALSGWIDMSPLMSIQPMLAVGSSDPFSFAFGSTFRYTLAGTSAAGFHAGLGFNLGTVGTAAIPPATGSTSTFFLNFFPVLGLQYGITQNIRMSFDGGMNFHVTPSPFQFSLGAASMILGASIHYFF